MGSIENALIGVVETALQEKEHAKRFFKFLEGGDLEIQAACSGQSLRLRVANPIDPEAPPRKGEGLGLGRLRRRLDTLYGSAASLRTRRDPKAFTVTVTV